MTKVIVQLFQVKEDNLRGLQGIGFMGLRELARVVGTDGSEGKPIDMSVYTMKYIANVDDGWVAGHYDMRRGFDKSDAAGLAAMFSQFNVEVELYREYGNWEFTGRSMSVGDIVGVERPVRGSKPVFYYCDNIGFKQVLVKNTPLPFEVGTPITRHSGSDSYPYHVSRISKSGKTFWAKAADHKPDTEGGHDYFSNQKYIVTPNDSSAEEPVRQHANGSWYMNGYAPVSIGHARYYQDPQF